MTADLALGLLLIAAALIAWAGTALSYVVERRWSQ